MRTIDEARVEKAKKAVLATLLDLSRQTREKSYEYHNLTTIIKNITKSTTFYRDWKTPDSRDIPGLLEDYVAQKLVLRIAIRQSTGKKYLGYLANLKRESEIEEILGDS